MRAPLAVVAVTLAALSLATFPGSARAHPHVFIANAIEFAMTGTTLAEIRFSWTFDEMYSSAMIADYVKSKGAALSADDVKSLRKNSFDNLAEFNYFVALSIDGERLRIQRPTSFAARRAEGRISFDFAIPVGKSLRDGSRVEVTAFDPEYYVEYTLREGTGYRIVGETPLTATCEVVPPQRTAQSAYPISGDVVGCLWRPKN